MFQVQQYCIPASLYRLRFLFAMIESESCNAQGLFAAGEAVWGSQLTHGVEVSLLPAD
jgi:hypothetical protein